MPAKDIEVRRATWRRWKERHPEKAKEASGQWKKSDYVKLNRQQEGLNEKYRRKAVRERGGMCERCRLTPASVDLHMHHIDLDNKNNRDDNLILLCRICHEKEHHKI